MTPDLAPPTETTRQRAADWLAHARPELQLLVLDAARPQRVQELFWRHVKGTPMQPYFAPPERGSIHSYGMAVDATLADAQGRELDMGTPFDDTTELSHPALEHAHAAAGRLGPEALAHRRLLRTAMLHGSWQAIATEWWHFDHGDRDVANWRQHLEARGAFGELRHVPRPASGCGAGRYFDRAAGPDPCDRSGSHASDGDHGQPGAGPRPGGHGDDQPDLRQPGQLRGADGAGRALLVRWARRGTAAATLSGHDRA